MVLEDLMVYFGSLEDGLFDRVDIGIWPGSWFLQWEVVIGTCCSVNRHLVVSWGGDIEKEWLGSLDGWLVSGDCCREKKMIYGQYRIKMITSL